jgi:hypothetical protein
VLGKKTCVVVVVWLICAGWVMAMVVTMLMPTASYLGNVLSLFRVVSFEALE